MTVIAALVQDGKVHMAADTASILDGDLFYQPGKLLRLPVGTTGRDAVIGMAGSGAVMSLVAQHLTLSAPPASDTDLELRRWAGAVAGVICELAVDAKPSVLEDDGKIDAWCLLGYDGHLWLLCQQDAIRLLEPIAAIGSGGNLALGALAALPGDLMPARDQLEAAVEVACRFDQSCQVTPAGMRYECV